MDWFNALLWADFAFGFIFGVFAVFLVNRFLPADYTYADFKRYTDDRRAREAAAKRQP